MNFLKKLEIVYYLLHGTIIGLTFVAFLVSSIVVETRMLILLSIIIILALKRVSSSIDKKRSLTLLIFGLFFGYILFSISLYRDGLHIIYPTDYNDSGPNNKNSVIIVFPTYPPAYSKESWGHIIRNSNPYRCNQTRLAFPFLLNISKNIYKRIGLDPSDWETKDFFNSFIAEEELEDLNIYYSYLYHRPILEEQVIKAMQEGAEKIIIINILLDHSNQWFEIQERIEKVRMYNLNSQILYSEALWDNEKIIANVTRNILDISEYKFKKNIGVLFIAKGYKNDKSEAYNESINQQTLFFLSIKHRLLDYGYDDDKIVIAHHNDPRYPIKEKMFQLLDEGITGLIIVPIYTPFEGLENLIMIPDIVDKVDKPSSLEINYVNGWSLDSRFNKEIINMITKLRSE